MKARECDGQGGVGFDHLVRGNLWEPVVESSGGTFDSANIYIRKEKENPRENYFEHIISRRFNLKLLNPILKIRITRWCMKNNPKDTNKIIYEIIS